MFENKKMQSRIPKQQQTTNQQINEQNPIGEVTLHSKIRLSKWVT